MVDCCIFIQCNVYCYMSNCHQVDCCILLLCIAAPTYISTSYMHLIHYMLSTMNDVNNETTRIQIVRRQAYDGLLLVWILLLLLVFSMSCFIFGTITSTSLIALPFPKRRRRCRTLNNKPTTDRRGDKLMMAVALIV